MELVKSFLEYLLADKGASPRTAAAYEGDLRAFERFFGSLEGQLDWQSVDGDVVRRWVVERMENGAQPQAVKRSLSALRSFYKYLLKTGRAERDPARLVRNPKVGKPLPVFVREGEMDRLLDETTFPEGYVGCRDRLLLLVLYTTGLRVSELQSLDLAAVDLAAGELKVTGKRNKQRIVPFGEELTSEIRRFLPLRREVATDSPALLLRPDGRSMRVPEIRAVVKKYLSLVTAQEKRTPHVLRHTFATVMLNNGADLGAVKELLGHESLATTEIYTHTTFSELKKQYAAAHPRQHGEAARQHPTNETNVPQGIHTIHRKPLNE